MHRGCAFQSYTIQIALSFCLIPSLGWYLRCCVETETRFESEFSDSFFLLITYWVNLWADFEMCKPHFLRKQSEGLLQNHSKYLTQHLIYVIKFRINVWMALPADPWCVLRMLWFFFQKAVIYMCSRDCICLKTHLKTDIKEIQEPTDALPLHQVPCWK